MKTLLMMSLSGSVMILAVLLLRKLLQARVSRTVWLVLWTIVVLRLLVPLSFSSPLSPYALLDPKPAAVGSELAPAAGSQTVDAAVPQEAAQTVRAAAPQTARLHLDTVALLIWASGAAAVFVWILTRHLIERFRYGEALPVEAPVPLPDGVRVRRLEWLQTPLTYGVFRPVILLPGWCDPAEEKTRYVLAHELTHIRCRDVLKKWALLFALSIHWFNPLVWLMVRFVTQDIELRCDALTVRRLSHAGRCVYARTLVAAEEQRFLGILQASFSTNDTVLRLRALQKGRKRPVWASTLAALVLSAVLIGVFAPWQRTAAASPQPSAEAIRPLDPEPSAAPTLPREAAQFTAEAAPPAETVPPATEEQTEVPPETAAQDSDANRIRSETVPPETMRITQEAEFWSDRIDAVGFPSGVYIVMHYRVSPWAKISFYTDSDVATVKSWGNGELRLYTWLDPRLFNGYSTVYANVDGKVYNLGTVRVCHANP